MLIQLINQHPEAIFAIVNKTPVWVWGLLAGLLFLGASQMRAQSLSLRRVVILPLAMFGLALYGLASVFYGGGQFGTVLAVWLLGFLATLTVVAQLPAATGTAYCPTQGKFQVPGSAVPMALILGIFLTKYAVGVELAMSPDQAADPDFAQSVALLYGAFSGIFAGRGLRLLRLVPRHAPASAGWLGQRLLTQRDPW